MKHLLTIAFTSACLFSFGQTNMFWNNYSNFNPAMSGFQHEQHGAISYQNLYPALSGNYSTLGANYNMRLSGKHGVGINYDGDFYSVMNNKITANYNYQVDLKAAGKLSTGIGIGAGRTQYRYEFYDEFGQLFTPSPYSYFNLSFGVAYSWKNLLFGASTSNLFSETDPALSSTIRSIPGWNTYVSHNFQLGKKFDLTTRAIFRTYNGFHRLDVNVTTIFDDRFSLGLTASARENFGVNLGYDIKKKFRVAYHYDFQFSKLNNGISGGSHELAIGYFLKSKQPKKTTHPMEPTF